jgi:hypothetical protein
MIRTIAAAIPFVVFIITAPAAVSQIANPVEIPGEVKVPGEWKACTQDSDCSFTAGCGDCCRQTTINAQWVEAYEKLSQDQCKIPRRPPCPCVYRKPVCNQGVCNRSP